MSRQTPTLGDMFRARPARSAVLSFAPILFAGAQGANAVVHGVASPLVAAFVLGLLAFAVGTTRHSLASFRIEALEADLFEERP